jgi:hypothetical protein
MTALGSDRILHPIDAIVDLARDHVEHTAEQFDEARSGEARPRSLE